MEDDDSLSNSSIYNSDNPPSARSVRKMVKRQKSNAEEVMAAVTKALEKISRYNDSLEKKEKVDEDRNLIEMIYTMLQSISDGMSKAMLRTELQQKIIQVK